MYSSPAVLRCPRSFVGLLLVALVLCVSGRAQDAPHSPVVIPDRPVSMSELVDIIRNDEAGEHQGFLPGPLAASLGLTVDNSKLAVIQRSVSDDARGILK